MKMTCLIVWRGFVVTINTTADGKLANGLISRYLKPGQHLEL